MPNISRQTLTMNCAGVDLVSPLDRMPEGHFPYLNNIRVLQEGRLESRPGYAKFNTTALATTALHSIRRLNDVSKVFAAAGYIYVVGDSTELWAGTENALASIDTGYSGNPLSLVSFRPENSPVAYMYVYDANKQAKVRPDATVRPIGVVPPIAPGLTSAEYGTPAMAVLDEGQATTGWTKTGAISSISLNDRQLTGGSNDGTIGSILYNSGSTGWCCIIPNNPVNPNWAGARMRVILNTGGGNAETVLVREIHPAIVSTTVAAISYDSGSTGLCSLVLTNSPTALARNSLISINNGVNTDLIRVLAVIPSPDGTTYSVRCSTTHTMAAGNAVTGSISWYTYTTVNHVAAETLTANCVYAHGSAPSGSSQTSNIARLVSIDASKANSRAVDQANDWMHISVWATFSAGVTQMRLYIDIDANTSSLGTAFTNNYLYWTLTPAQVFGGAPQTLTAGGSWFEVLVPLSAATRVGNDPTRTLANIKALKIEWTQTSIGDIAFDWWYLFGTYGPTIQPNSPVGYLYETRYRDSTTGAASVPGPATRYTLNPLREEVLVTPQTTAVSSVDSCDVYRQGGTLTQFTFDGTVVNNNGSPNTFHDDFSDNSIISNPAADLTLLQPWPIIDVTWSGTVNVIGTTVIWQTGTHFNTALVAGTVILINGVAYQTYGNPISTTILEITSSGGSQTGVPFIVASPILAGQTLPFVFGPLEGPFAPIAFGLGDSKNAGTLYFTNAANLDGASDLNTLEVCPPSEPLVSGDTWNGLVIVGSRDNIYLIRYTYIPTPGTSGPGTFQIQRLQSPSGIWSRWACKRGPDGVYFLGRDGLYRANEQGVMSITDGMLYPLFPHDGQNLASGANTNAVGAPDMTQLSKLRLSVCDNDLYFDYVPL